MQWELTQNVGEKPQSQKEECRFIKSYSNNSIHTPGFKT